MKSRTSCFDGRFSLHLLRRFWPLWLLWLAILLIVPLGLHENYEGLDALQTMDGIRCELLDAGEVVVWLSFVMGALMAMGMLSWLYFPRDCALVSSLPLRRETVYFTAVLTGLVPMLVCDVLVFLLLLALYGGSGAGTQYFLWWLEMAVLANVGSYGFACFCGTLTGSILVLPAVYVVLACAAALFEASVHGLFDELLYGYMSGDLHFDFLSPPIWLVSRVWRKTLVSADFKIGVAGNYAPTVLDYLAGLCAAGVIFVLLGVLILRRRHMETAGEVVAVPVLRPVFRACMALGAGLLGSVLFLEAFACHLHGRTKFVLLLVLLVVFAALGYFIAEMLIKKTLKVFDHGWKQLGILCAALIALAVLTELDVTGFETRVPEAAGIESVDLSDGWQVKEPETIAAILDFHRGVIDHKKANEAAGTLQSETVWLSYQLKNGETLRRLYLLPLSDRHRADPASDVRAWERVLNLPELLLLRIRADRPPTADTLEDAWVEVYSIAENLYKRSEIVPLTRDEALSLYYDAILPDAEAGRIGRHRIWSGGETTSAQTNLEIAMTIRSGTASGRSASRALDVRVCSDSALTLKWLKDKLDLEPTPGLW